MVESLGAWGLASACVGDRVFNEKTPRYENEFEESSHMRLWYIYLTLNFHILQQLVRHKSCLINFRAIAFLSIPHTVTVPLFSHRVHCSPFPSPYCLSPPSPGLP